MTSTTPSAPSRGDRGHALFVAAAGVMALHVVDDSLLQPAAGTSRLDHLVSGTVPVLVLAALAVAWPRLRAGWQALVALPLGAVLVVAGATGAGYHAVTVGPSGADLTGLATVPAGLLLVGLGLTLLWTSRRRDDHPAWRWTRRVLMLSLVPVVFGYLVLPVGVAWLATHSITHTVPEAHLGAPHEDVTLRTSDGLDLEGWYVPSRNGAAVIAFPGRNGPQKHTRMLVRHGYGVLLFDRRGEGDSEGESNLFGWGGTKDIDAAVDFLEQRPDVDPDRIGGIGLSVGGELMLQAAAESDRLDAVVSEGAGTRSLGEELEELSTGQLVVGLPTLVVKAAALSVFADATPPPKLTDLMPRVTAPVLLIWAPNGGNLEIMNPEYRRLAGGPASIWRIDDAMHIQGITAHPAAYERRVVGFFDDTLVRR
jgi:dienelactone hydrolase